MTPWPSVLAKTARCRLAAITLFAAAVGLSACAEFWEDDAAHARDIVARAEATVNRFKTSTALKTKEFRKFLPDARAIVVLPTVVKAGFIGGAEGGSGVFLVRREDGTWSYPAFYTLAAGSVGLQAGIQGTEIVLIVRRDKAIDAILRHQAKLGADFGLTVGVFGGGMEASTTTNLGPDVLAFAQSIAGVYGGLSLEGAALVRRNDLNQAYYGVPAAPRAIVVDGSFKNAGADGLRAALAAP
jgi:lipid-binding SYLF domain-containing protein